jgi:FkbM family methyltransferase
VGRKITFYMRLKKKISQIFIRNPDSFFKKIDGIIHIGANVGQERLYYEQCGLSVIWVEPIPRVFDQLSKNISTLPGQVAYQYLLSDSDGKFYDFKVIGEGGESSSIFDLAEHANVWPGIVHIESIPLVSAKLTTMIKNERIDIKKYQGLVLDTQGSELLVLRGANEILHNFSFIKVEAADFNAYEGCCQIDELIAYLQQFNFFEKKRSKFAEHPSGGGYYDLIFYRH